MLQRLNTHGVALTGLAIGGGSIVASVAALFKLLDNTSYLWALYVASKHARVHALTDADVMTYIQLAAACIAIIGAVTVAILLSFLGRSSRLSYANAAAQAATPPKKDG